MRVRHTFDFDDEDREAIAFGNEEKGTAPREDVLEWLLSTVDAAMTELRQRYLIARDPEDPTSLESDGESEEESS